MFNNFAYFKYFNETNKVSRYIRNENNYINYDDLFLDLIYEEEDINLAEVIFPIIENNHY